jgi:hypothetical protein
VRRGRRIAGASGALPLWLAAAKSIAASEKHGEMIEMADLAFATDKFLPLFHPPEMAQIMASKITGLSASATALSSPENPATAGGLTETDTLVPLWTYGSLMQGRFQPLRFFLPVESGSGVAP